MLVKELPDVLPVPMVIYVAGKLTTDGPEHIERHARAAEAHALRLFEMGHIPFTCHSMYRTWRPIEQASEAFRKKIIYGLNLTFLRRCDAISVIPGWEDSEGTKIEIEYMKKLERPVYFSFDEIPKVEVEPSGENQWMMEVNDKIDGASRLRLLYGLSKYQNSWTDKDNLQEALEEVLDGGNYAKLEIFRLLRLMEKRDGIFPQLLREESRQ